MLQNKQILWLGPVFDGATLISARAVSPAANRWQLGLIHALQEIGVNINVISHLPEPAWPRGRLCVRAQDGCLPASIQGQLTGYWNLPVWRRRSLIHGYRKLIRRIGVSGISTGVVVTYNGTPANVAGAMYARKRYGMPWVCVVADDEAPPDADGYILLSWGYYEAFATSKPKLHLDGGVSEIRFSLQGSAYKSPHDRQVVMYTGAMTRYGGVDFLARSFHLVDNPQAELWICGKGSNPEVERLATIDPRIKLKGFVPEQELQQLMQRADVFVNPRPSNVPGNEKNFPSKILEYLSYGKPVISTWTEGLSPEYHEILIVLEQESEEYLAETIKRVLRWGQAQRAEWAEKVINFLIPRKMWSIQANRLQEWLEPKWVW